MQLMLQEAKYKTYMYLLFRNELSQDVLDDDLKATANSNVDKEVQVAYGYRLHDHVAQA